MLLLLLGPVSPLMTLRYLERFLNKEIHHSGRSIEMYALNKGLSISKTTYVQLDVQLRGFGIASIIVTSLLQPGPGAPGNCLPLLEGFPSPKTMPMDIGYGLLVLVLLDLTRF